MEVSELTSFRIVRDLDGSKIHDYHKGRLYVILFERLPFDSDSRVYEFDEFKYICEEVLKLSEELEKKGSE